MRIETLTMKYRKARLVNQTSNGYVAQAPVIKKPSGDLGTATGQAVIDLGKDGEFVQNFLKIVPYGTGADNATFSLRVIGWTAITDPATNNTLWIPTNLCELACTLCTAVGVDGYPVTSAERFADTISVTKGSTLSGESPSENVVSPADNTIGHALIDLKGNHIVEITFTTGGSATDCNALVSLL